ncbi:MAG: c-type cytochrome [Bacteriovoracales bacterium]|nr:c-type cytochrome [Bacteriovoracales bacterium]
MVKLIFFLATLISFALVLTLGRYQNLPVNNETFKAQEKKRMLLEEKKRRKALAAKEAEAKALALAKKPTLVLDTPELKNGYEVYFKKGKCITCHGKKGEGKTSQKAPKLAAQHDWYIYSSLVKFKKRERVNKKMEPYLRNLTESDFKDVATYLSKLPPQ